jgi:cupin fold WbuC family metalloprotein
MLINTTLLTQLSSIAKQTPRLRKNQNFHATDTAPCHRLLNAIEPGSYIPVHCHLDANKEESIIVLCGKLGIVLFNANGTVSAIHTLSIQSDIIGINIPVGQFHSVLALEPNTVFFEAKAGPYLPLSAQEIASFSPIETDPAAPAYALWLRSLFS